ncbi:hypothetical protein GEMRC1_001964 [Eukaryota sp. GEM-RC1]
MGNKASRPTTVPPPDAGTTRRSRGATPATRKARTDNNASAPNRRANPNRNGNPSSNRRDFFIDHSNNPIKIPNIFGKPRTDDVRSALNILARSDPELQRQGKFLFDETYGSYYANFSVSDETKQAKRMRSAWVDATRKRHNRFLILKHWNPRHQMVKEPMLLVTRTGNKYVAQQTHSWTLFRRSTYASTRRGPVQMGMKGFIQEFSSKLRAQFGNRRPKWEIYLYRGYIYTKHMPRILKQNEADLINNQIFTLFLYILEYHKIDVSDITQFAGMERNAPLTAGHLGDAFLFLPRYLIEQVNDLENHPFSDRDREICGEWNMRETVEYRAQIQNAFRDVRI